MAVSVSPHVKAGTDILEPIKGIDETFVERIRGIPVEMEEATGAVPSCLRGYRTTSCTSKIGRGIRATYPRKEPEENRISPPLKYFIDRRLQYNIAKYPIT